MAGLCIWKQGSKMMTMSFCVIDLVFCLTWLKECQKRRQKAWNVRHCVDIHVLVQFLSHCFVQLTVLWAKVTSQSKDKYIPLYDHFVVLGHQKTVLQERRLVLVMVNLSMMMNVCGWQAERIRSHDSGILSVDMASHGRTQLMMF